MKRLTIIFAAILCLCSCEKNNGKGAIQEKSIKELSKELYFGEYSKELVVYDDSGKNSAVIKVGTNDPAYFDLLTADNLKIIPVKKGQSAAEAVNLYNKQNGIVYSEECQEEEDETLDNNEENGTHLYTMILSKSLADDVDGLILINQAPNPAKAEWQFQTDYGYAPTAGAFEGYQEAVFVGQNGLYVGYYRLSYMLLSTREISWIVPDWTKIRTNQTQQYLRGDCRVMTAYRKYKGTNNPSVIVYFTY